MNEPNMTCMIINVWIHHMQIDELFDFLNMRINTAPYYWLNEASVPTSVTGGYVMISLTYAAYSHLSSNRHWDEAPGWIKQ